MSRVVVDLEDRRPIWAMPDWAVEELRAALPEDWELYISRSLVDGSGDGASEPSEEVLRAVEGARVYIGFGIPAAVVEAGEPTLEWVHSGAAGVGSSLHEPMLRSEVRFTNSAGIHGPPIAETVLGMLLHFARGFDFALAGKQEHRWNNEPYLAADTPVRELSSMTVGIIGYGGIGREIGGRVRALGARVLGLRGTPPGSTEDEIGTRLLHGEEGLSELIRASDAVVVSAPDTPETRLIVDRERIRAMRPGSVLINVARGRLVDEDGLLEALEEGHLRGAGLDVFQTEPLPGDHPFWSRPDVLITPHVSAVSRGFWRREMDLILENLIRLRRGEPLRNEVDRTRGY